MLTKDPKELEKLQKFAEEGGIGACVAKQDTTANTEDDLMFFEGDKITVLKHIRDDLYLGYCEGVIGHFSENTVIFNTGNLPSPSLLFPPNSYHASNQNSSSLKSPFSSIASASSSPSSSPTSLSSSFVPRRQNSVPISSSGSVGLIQSKYGQQNKHTPRRQNTFPEFHRKVDINSHSSTAGEPGPSSNTFLTKKSSRTSVAEIANNINIYQSPTNPVGIFDISQSQLSRPSAEGYSTYHPNYSSSGQTSPHSNKSSPGFSLQMSEVRAEAMNNDIPKSSMRHWQSAENLKNHKHISSRKDFIVRANNLNHVRNDRIPRIDEQIPLRNDQNCLQDQQILPPTRSHTLPFNHLLQNQTPHNHKYDGQLMSDQSDLTIISSSNVSSSRGKTIGPNINAQKHGKRMSITMTNVSTLSSTNFTSKTPTIPTRDASIPTVVIETSSDNLKSTLVPYAENGSTDRSSLFAVDTKSSSPSSTRDNFSSSPKQNILLSNPPSGVDFQWLVDSSSSDSQSSSPISLASSSIRSPPSPLSQSSLPRILNSEDDEEDDQESLIAYSSSRNKRNAAIHKPVTAVNPQVQRQQNPIIPSLVVSHVSLSDTMPTLKRAVEQLSSKDSIDITSDEEIEPDYTEAKANDERSINIVNGSTQKPMAQRKEQILAIDDYGFVLEVSEAEIPEGGDRIQRVFRTPKADENKSRSLRLYREREVKWVNIFTNMDTSTARESRRIKKLVRQGIPESVRGKAWQFMAGAGKYRKPKVYEVLRKRERLPIYDVIERDIHRCYPDHIQFREGNGSGQSDLHDILKAYAHYNPAVGYCQGMGRLVGMMLMQMPAEDTFWLLVATIEEYMNGYFGPTLSQLRIDSVVFEQLLAEHDPKLAQHLADNDIVPLMYMTQWFMTIFTMSLPWASVLRIWDVFYFEGVKLFFRVGLAIMDCTRDHILKKCPSSSEIMDFLLHIPPEMLTPDLLLDAAFNVRLRRSSIRRLAKRVATESNGGSSGVDGHSDPRQNGNGRSSPNSSVNPFGSSRDQAQIRGKQSNLIGVGTSGFQTLKKSKSSEDRVKVGGVEFKLIVDGS
ncbi:hypothetical protein G9A89_004845 [Geosiphon pyriformis]|nr:hypothetical protein G9A89_004845 [Geosiphon pyriformis]